MNLWPPKRIQFRIALAFKPLQKPVCLKTCQLPSNLLRRRPCSRLRVRPLSLGEIGVAVQPLEGIVSDWIKVKNPHSPAMIRHREGRWE